MSAATPSVAISVPLLEEATRRAEQLGVSTQDWVHIALEERIRLEEQEGALWRERSGRATNRRLTEILLGGNDNPPDAHDEMPAGRS